MGDILTSIESFKKFLADGDKHESVEVQSPEEWDPRGQYKDVIEAVASASSSGQNVKVYRVQHDRARVQYFVLVLGKGGKLIGVSATAVES
jgi:hypothetical protein